MGLPAPDGTIAWNGKVPPESGGVMIDPGSPLAAGPGKCRDSALGTLSPVLVGRNFHRGDDPLSAGQEASQASTGQQGGDVAAGEAHVAAGHEASSRRGDGRKASGRGDGAAAAASDGDRGDGAADKIGRAHV